MSFECDELDGKYSHRL